MRVDRLVFAIGCLVAVVAACLIVADVLRADADEELVAEFLAQNETTAIVQVTADMANQTGPVIVTTTAHACETTNATITHPGGLRLPVFSAVYGRKCRYEFDFDDGAPLVYIGDLCTDVPHTFCIAGTYVVRASAPISVLVARLAPTTSNSVLLRPGALVSIVALVLGLVGVCARRWQTARGAKEAVGRSAGACR
mmetsp:Transcript_120054/g.346813  ORF Transcript_120054/g.346813 Transcript_120054/m.346813 type:complete len:196 (-) Transcript_120054:240-827(-)